MASSTSASTSATSTAKVCFNSNCKKALEHSRNGWRRRSGDFAELCDCCASAYEEGIFCETFHLNASGWRCCETCGKQIHCGCIVSFHMFVLLDAGGIECLTCTRKSFILTPNPAWPPPSLSHFSQPERIKDLPSKCSIAASSPVTWRQPPTFFSDSSIKSELRAKAPSEIDVSVGIGRFIHKDLSASSLEKKKNGDPVERLTIQSLKTGVSEVLENGNTVRCEDQSNTCLSGSRHTFFSKNDSSFPNINLAKVSSSKSGKKNHAKSSVALTKPLIPSTSVGKQTSHTGLETSAEAQASNGRARENGQGRNHLHPPNWPRVTDQELQPVSGDTNYVITLLFEKMLTPSDAGPMGRLILPKKCAEAYLPPISHPEGLPLKVQDLKGNEWITQFRFWPNNNSRMYVLEGVTPCIQSMRLQAGDTVTFSRIEPGGKLVMGGRKTSTAPRSDQGNGTGITGDGVSANGKNSSKSAKPAVNKCGGHVGNEGVAAKTSIRGKRKNITLASKSKRLKTENENMTELKLTRRQAQGLMRQPPNNVPEVSVIEGCEIEEYEQDAPIIGRPTIPATDDMGEKIQWVQCEVCLKWRKMPADTLLPSRWTCSSNSTDPERSDCSAAQELTVEQLADLLPTVSNAALKKIRAGKQDLDLVETLEGLDALADLAIQEEGGSSQATTRHPRHKPGCTCIVCMQRPSGKGPKHKPTCDCMVCQSVKRRFRTLMTKREKKLGQDTDMDPSGEIGAYTPMQESVNGEVSFDESNEKNHPSPFKARIDLNIQPKRDEEFPPGTSSASILHLLHDATGRHFRQQTHSFSAGGGVLVGNQNHQNGQGGTNLLHEATESHLRQQPHSFSGGEGDLAGNPNHQNGQEETNFSSCSALDKSHERMDADRNRALSGDTMVSASTTQ